MTPGYYNVVIRSGSAPVPSLPRHVPAAASDESSAATPRGVRRARPDDAGAIEAMMRAAHAESPIYRAMPIDDRKLKGYIADVIHSKDHAVLLHEGAAGIDGLYIGMLVQQFFTLEVTAMDILFYVRPQRRGTRAAVRLWRAFEQWAAARGAKAIQVGTMTEIDPARTAKFYQGMGLRDIGGVFHNRIG
jgi:GNAT superfamily N-acetyltransferase